MANLTLTHNAGFFSCSSVALRQLLEYFNREKSTPDSVDRSNQYANCRTNSSQDMTKVYFEDGSDVEILYNGGVGVTDEDREDQFSNYKNFNFSNISPFVKKYFQPSRLIEDRVQELLNKYYIEYDNTCAIYYRGNDKCTETVIAPYGAFIEKAQVLLLEDPSLKFLVQTDEREFLDEFIATFPNSTTYVEELAMMSRDPSNCMFRVIPETDKSQNSIDYLAVNVMLSRCKHLVTHSGNGGMWSVLYRGHGNYVYQNLNNEWI